MIRKFNYTNRKRIQRDEVNISVHENEAGIDLVTDLTKVPIDEYPAGGRVYLEVYRQTVLERFSYGTVDNMNVVRGFKLIKFDSTEDLLFRIKIVDLSPSNRILALGDRIPLIATKDKIAQKIPLLPVISKDLGDEIYKLVFGADGPSLEVNSQLGSKDEIVRHPAFESLIFPKILQKVLTKIYLINKTFDYSDCDSWESRWIIYSHKIPGNDEPLEDESTIDECERWIEEAVLYFTKYKRYKNKYRKFLSEEQ